jgi:hypothetical protein
VRDRWRRVHSEPAIKTSPAAASALTEIERYWESQCQPLCRYVYIRNVEPTLSVARSAKVDIFNLSGISCFGRARELREGQTICIRTLINHRALEFRGSRKVERTRHTNNSTYKSRALQHEKLTQNREIISHRTLPGPTAPFFDMKLS